MTLLKVIFISLSVYMYNDELLRISTFHRCKKSYYAV